MPTAHTLRFASLVNMFRLAAIVHGVLARGLSGIAASGSSQNDRMEATFVGILSIATNMISEGDGAPAARL